MSIITDAHEALIDHLRDVSWTDSQGATRKFDHVAEHEPAQAPGKGIYAAVWFDDIRPSAEMSTLSGAAMVYTYNVRMYRRTTSSPADSIDPDLVAALDAVLESVFGDARLGDTAYTVDVLGAYSAGVSAVTDYVDFGRNDWYRVVDLTLPIVGKGEIAYG